MKGDDMKELFRQASEIASVVPESMQAEAFNRALEALKGVHAPSGQHGPVNNHEATKKQKGSGEIASDWYERINSTEHPEVADAKNNLTQALLILKIAHDELNIDALTPNEISEALKEKFKLKVSSTTVSARLGEATKLVDRSSNGTGHSYRLMLPGEKYIRGEYEGAIGNSKKPVGKTKAKPNSDDSKPNESKIAKPKASRSTNGRPAQRKLLEDLISEGYFDEPKTVGDVIDYVKQNLAYTYKATDLSTPLVRMVRSKQLKRRTNDDSQFEYCTS